MDYNKIKAQLEIGVSFAQLAREFHLPKSTFISRCHSKGLFYKKILKEMKTKRCGKCKVYKPKEEFYFIKPHPKLSSYCKNCTGAECVERKRNFKFLCLKYRGNKCEICGYNKYAGALHFHHLDPIVKDFNISKYKAHVLTNKVKQELDKCQVLCSNCHAEVHSKYPSH